MLAGRLRVELRDQAIESILDIGRGHSARWVRCAGLEECNEAAPGTGLAPPDQHVCSRARANRAPWHGVAQRGVPGLSKDRLVAGKQHRELAQEVEAGSDGGFGEQRPVLGGAIGEEQEASWVVENFYVAEPPLRERRRGDRDDIDVQPVVGLRRHHVSFRSLLLEIALAQSLL